MRVNGENSNRFFWRVLAFSWFFRLFLVVDSNYEKTTTDDKQERSHECCSYWAFHASVGSLQKDWGIACLYLFLWKVDFDVLWMIGRGVGGV